MVPARRISSGDSSGIKNPLMANHSSRRRMLMHTVLRSFGFYCVPSMLAIPALILDQLTELRLLAPIQSIK
jgi:hypothetical protein